MRKISHSELKTLARRMRTRQEIKNRVSIFDTAYWNKRTEGIRSKVKNKLKKINERKNLQSKIKE